MFELKQYQKDALAKLGEYLRLAAEKGAQAAYYGLGEGPYIPVSELPELPYVCLRVPTGGGKTVMAAHAVGLATHDLLSADRSVVLWLAPTNQIVEQTLRALRERGHPWREALDLSVGGPVAVMNLAEALSLKRPDLDGQTCVIVSTLAALRVTDTTGRRVYEQNGDLMTHFIGLDAALEQGLERNEAGAVIKSLANVLRLRRTVVIMDEAHNARTRLSFETLARFGPSCVLEFTATPERTHDPKRGHFASNVLCHVSAWELKADAMIKMPIRLEADADWQRALSGALKKREELETLAASEAAQTGEYIRPILLVQAQPRSSDRETLNVEVVKKALLEDHKVPEEWLKVATGEERGIAGLNLLAQDCPVRVIITVQALKEGWDCSFAYVLCSVADISSQTAVEQILGRIMRLPHARLKRHEDLNVAWAFATSPQLAYAAFHLRDGLVANGFDEIEAQHLVDFWQQPLPEMGGLFADQEPRVESPSDRGERFEVPVLSRWVNGKLELLEPEDFLPYDWDLSECDWRLTPAEFSLSAASSKVAEIDTEAGRIRVSFIDQARLEMASLDRLAAWSAETLTNWLDRNIPHPDIPQAQSTLFILNLVRCLNDERDMTLGDLTRERYRLLGSIQARIEAHRHDAKGKTCHQLLLGEAADFGEVRVDPGCCFAYEQGRYPANEIYRGAYRFRKHYFAEVGDLKADGEEFHCAVAIDNLPEVKHWVRNIAGKPAQSFWLPTTTDRFYPDFVAELNDDRYLVVEYKGAHIVDTPDTREKEALGKLWADRSGGKCVFVLATAGSLGDLRREVALGRTE